MTENTGSDAYKKHLSNAIQRANSLEMENDRLRDEVARLQSKCDELSAIKRTIKELVEVGEDEE